MGEFDPYYGLKALGQTAMAPATHHLDVVDGHIYDSVVD